MLSIWSLAYYASQVLHRDVLTLLAALLSGWVVQRELAPLQQAADTVRRLAEADQPCAPLVVERHDEIGTLLSAFNRLLGRLGQREAELRCSKAVLEASERIGGLGSYVFDLATGTWESTVVADQLFGIDKSYPHTPEGWTALVHPEDQAVRWIHGRGQLDCDAQGRPTTLRGTLQDVTERKLFEQELQASLKEKVALLNEVHHRVKNNLQVIASLLRLESGRSSQGETRSVLAEMQGRIHAMALLHESLYRSGVFASVDLGSYLKQLAAQAFRAHARSRGAVRLECDAVSVRVSMDVATPCGLLVNELLSNSLKHGFPDGREGTVSLHVARVADSRQVRLRVQDNGIGLGADFETQRKTSLGLQLVADLARQLHGTLEVGPGPGACFIVAFDLLESQ